MKTITMDLKEYERIKEQEEDRENFYSIYYSKYEVLKKEFAENIKENTKSHFIFLYLILIIETLYILLTQ
ncbi:hypothetical protein GW796_01045 [archaeon]|nr:hypothetical protein [archaeon]